MKLAVIVPTLCVLLCTPLTAQEKEKLPAWETYKYKTSDSIYSGLSVPTGTIEDARKQGKAVTIRSSKTKAELLADKDQLVKAIALFPLAELYFNLGNVHYFLGDYAKALLCFQIAAFRDYEEVWWAYYNGACAASLLSLVDLALEYLEKAADWGLPDFKPMKTDPDLAACRQSPKYAALMKRIVNTNNVPEIFRLSGSLYNDSGYFSQQEKYYYAGLEIPPNEINVDPGEISIKDGDIKFLENPEKTIYAFEARGAKFTKRDRDQILAKETVMCTITEEGTEKTAPEKRELEVKKVLLGEWKFAQGHYQLTLTALLRLIPENAQSAWQLFEGSPKMTAKTTKLERAVIIRLTVGRPKLMPLYEERLNLGWPSLTRIISVDFFPELFSGPVIRQEWKRYELEHMP